MRRDCNNTLGGCPWAPSALKGHQWVPSAWVIATLIKRKEKAKVDAKHKRVNQMVAMKQSSSTSMSPPVVKR